MLITFSVTAAGKFFGNTEVIISFSSSNKSIWPAKLEKKENRSELQAKNPLKVKK